MKLIFTISGFITILLFSTVLFAQQMTPIEHLGRMIYFDPISNPDGMSCATCHAPQAGFTGPQSSINKRFGIYFGSITERFGNRNPPTAAYATYSPVLHYDAVKQEFVGGNFWDGRATGLRLGNPAAEQALGPFLNPLEHNNANKKAVLMQIASAMYSNMWNMVWGEPISYNTEEKINLNYDRVGLSIAAYEGSMMVNSFSSKYDYYLKGQATLTPQELQGLNLFNGDAQCSSCHSSGGLQPLFTDFTYENVGAPKNPDNPFYDMDQVFINGVPINPQGEAWIDRGLGGFLETLPAEDPWNQLAPANMGKHKVPTLRNVDKRPTSNFTKAYFHNGVFKSLKEVVHFFNTRDILQWSSPEVNANINTTIGNLGLTNSEEDAIVAFLSTLSDSYTMGGGGGGGGGGGMGRSSELKINGPNPFNPSTQLMYYLTEEAVIQLDVFNVTGEKVTTLEYGLMSAGEHRVEFNANRLPSGLYIAGLNTGSEFKTVKLMLVK